MRRTLPHDQMKPVPPGPMFTAPRRPMPPYCSWCDAPFLERQGYSVCPMCDTVPGLAVPA